MRIAVLGARSFPAQHGGLEVVVEDLSLALASRGHEVHVLVSETSGQVPEGVHVRRVGALRSKYTHTLSQMVASARLLKQIAPDVVSIHGVGAVIPFRWRSLVFGDAPILVTVHGIDWDREKWPMPARVLFRGVALPALRRVDEVASVSPSVARDLTKQLGAAVIVIPNALSLPTLSTTVPANLNGIGEFSVVSSRLTPEKNVLSIVEAYTPEVQEILGPLIVIGGGGGSYAGSYESRVQSAAVGAVFFTGSLRRSEALAIVARSARYLSASRLEAQPVAVMEALALGRKLILSNLPAHREVAGDSASYVDKNDSDGWAATFLDLRCHNRVDAMQVVRPVLTWGDVAALYESQFEKLISIRSPKGH